MAGQSTSWIATSASSAESHSRVRSAVVSVGSHPTVWIDGFARGTRPATASMTKNRAPSRVESASAQRTRGTGTRDGPSACSNRNSRNTSGARKMWFVVCSRRRTSEVVRVASPTVQLASNSTVSFDCPPAGRANLEISTRATPR